VFVMNCYFRVTRAWIGMTHRLEALLQRCVRPYKRYILMWGHRSICFQISNEFLYLNACSESGWPIDWKLYYSAVFGRIRGISWCELTGVFALKLVTSFYIWMLVLNTISVIIRFVLSSLYGGKHESIIDIWDRNGWQMSSSYYWKLTCICFTMCCGLRIFNVWAQRSCSILSRIRIISRCQENVGY